MKSFKAFVIVLCVFMVIFFAGMLFLRFQKNEEYLTLDMHYELTDKMGFNTDTDALYFGKGMPGTMAQRYVTINNSHEYPILVSIKLEGDVAPFITVSENDFIMQPREQHVITYYAESSKETPYGNYSGISTLVFKKITAK